MTAMPQALPVDRGGLYITPFNARQVMTSRDFEVYHYADNSPTHVMMHHHDFVEVYFLLSGEMHYVVEGTRYHLTPGHMLVITPNLLHHPDTQGAGSFERIVLWISLSYLTDLASQIPWIMFYLFAEGTGAHHLTAVDEGFSALKSIFSALLREKAACRFASDQYCASLMTQLFIHIQRMDSRQAGETLTPALSADAMYEVFQYINEHLADNLTLQGLAERFYVNMNTLSRRFKTHAGITVCEYIRKKRLAVARIKISQGMDISAASAACGFSRYSTFYRSFMQEYGISPSAFKKGRLRRY